MTDEQLSDSALITAYQNSGDAVYLGELYTRYSHLVYIICGGWLKNEEDRKDAVMEIFEKLMESLRQKNIDNFKPWLATVTKNYCITKLRKRSYRAQFAQEVEDFEKFVEGVENDDPKRHISRAVEETQHQALEAALKKLSDAQRECIELFYGENEGKSYKEIVKITGFSEKEVKSHIQNGKRKLKILLNEKG